MKKKTKELTELELRAVIRAMKFRNGKESNLMESVFRTSPESWYNYHLDEREDK